MADQEVDYNAVLAALERQKAETEQAIAAVRRLAGLASDEPMEGLDAFSIRTPAKLREDAFFGMSAPEAIREFLGFAKKPQSVATIADTLIRHGFVTRSENPTDFIRATLRRMHRDVIQVKKDWGLASWYRGAKVKTGTEPDATPKKKRGRPRKITAKDVFTPETKNP